MNILTAWLRTYLPSLPVSDRQLAEDLTLRGIAVEGVHDLGLDAHGQPNGHLFEMDITTNRVDAMNHYGIAREAATIYNLPLAPLLASDSGSQASDSRPAFPIQIDPEARHLCGRFTARVLRDVSISPSIGQTARFFSLLGQKSISNAVDASNFTLLGMGHPTHAFDLDKIDGGIVVRLARKGERLTLLDGTERTLEPDDLVIADHHKPLSLAGVMGGLGSSITAGTRNILVESAWFEPAGIRRSARRHGLHTDASHRFERGADFAAAPTANYLVTDLILASGGHTEGELIDLVDPETQSRTADRAAISLSLREVRRHLGATLADTPTESALTPSLVGQYLSALGCTLETASDQVSGRATLHAREDAAPGNTFWVTLPSWRLDLEREIDLIEEIARVFGYNRFANTLPTPRPVLTHPAHAAEHAVRSRLLALGLSETVSSTFASAADSHLFASAAGKGGHVALENPLSEDAANLRPSLLPGMLSMLANNLNRDVPTARLFEAGDIFRSPDRTTTRVDGVDETSSLALGITGDVPPAPPLQDAAAAPIFELKGVIESLASLFALPGGPEALTFSTANTPAWLEPGRSATALLGTHAVAHFGELARAESARRKLRQPVFLAEIDLASLYDLPLRKVTAHELSRFQAVDRDFSFVFPDATEWHTVAGSIRALSIPELTRLRPVEVWRNAAKYPGVYSLLLRATFQSPDRTLREDELTSFWSRIIQSLTDLGGTLRAP